jgi:hypothetical protein
MRTGRKIALSIALVIGGGVTWYMLAYPTYAYRYRMTVEVLVDGVLHTGASVVEIQLVKQPHFITSEQAVSPKVNGEAAFVDLGQGRNVFGLLASALHPTYRDYPVYLVPSRFKLSIVKDSDLAKISKLQGRWVLADDELPELATFSDLADPNTAIVLRPNEFGQVLGGGVQFKRVSIELTDDPVTHSIESRLLWLAGHKWSFGGRSGNLSGNDFIRRP